MKIVAWAQVAPTTSGVAPQRVRSDPAGFQQTWREAAQTDANLALAAVAGSDPKRDNADHVRDRPLADPLDDTADAGVTGAAVPAPLPVSVPLSAETDRATRTGSGSMAGDTAFLSGPDPAPRPLVEVRVGAVIPDLIPDGADMTVPATLPDGTSARGALSPTDRCPAVPRDVAAAGTPPIAAGPPSAAAGAAMASAGRQQAEPLRSADAPKAPSSLPGEAGQSLPLSARLEPFAAPDGDTAARSDGNPASPAATEGGRALPAILPRVGWPLVLARVAGLHARQPPPDGQAVMALSVPAGLPAGGTVERGTLSGAEGHGDPVPTMPVGPAVQGGPAPGASPGAATTDTPLPPVTRQIAESLRLAAGNRVELTLTPEELGKVTLSFLPEGDRLRVHLMADRPETLDLIRRHVAELAADLREQGYDMTSFSFGRSGGSPSWASSPDDLTSPSAEPTDALPGSMPAPAPSGLRGTLDLRL